MRQEVLDQVRGLYLTGWKVSDELPFDDRGEPLYVKNPRTVYVDNPQTEREPLIQTLGACTVYQTVTTIGIYFSADAKNTPATYNNTVESLRTLIDAEWTQRPYSSTVEVNTSYEKDLVVTEVALRLTTIK